jgi:hypothetical protein
LTRWCFEHHSLQPGSQPLLRAALSESNPGIDLFGHIFKVTSYTDDMQGIGYQRHSFEEIVPLIGLLSSRWPQYKSFPLLFMTHAKPWLYCRWPRLTLFWLV